jgi:hypothetical protein
LTALKKADEDFTNINQIEFKTVLWNRLVKNDFDRTDGLPQKREDAFIGIAVKRAKSMQMFIRPIGADPAVVNLLETDNIIIQDDSSGTYSPAHDILEDWALTYYVSRMSDNYPSPHELFARLGNEPAIRRGFRLWVNEKTSSSINSISGLVNTVLNDPSIEKYWSDELLVALLKSENCDTFVSEYKKLLLSNDLALLKKCIHFIRIVCKEKLYGDGHYQLLVPEGKIWEAIIIFIEQNISVLDTIRLSVIGLLSDWEAAFLLNKLNAKEVEISVRNIIIHYINQIETDNFVSLKYHERNNIFTRLVSILYNLAEISGENITELIKRAWEYKENQNEYELFGFYNIIIENCLSGEFPGSKLVRYMPDLVIDVAWKEWKLKPEKYTSFDEFYGTTIKRQLNHFEVWGIQNEMRFFPSGIYKTPFYFMLMTNPIKAIKFIVDFLNYSTKFYIHSFTTEYKHDLYQIDIVLNDGSKIKQWGGESFWLAYRGLSVTNDLIESLLFSVEKYLLECASKNTSTTQKIVKLLFDYIFLNSNNILLTSILASVSIAYPQVVEESMLPLLRVKEFYHFDLMRASREHSALSPVDYKISYAQIERHEFNQLPHRTKYARGLMNFIVYYQLNIRTINDKIFHIFDDLKSKDDKSDESWTKTLTEIDIRNYYKKEYDDTIGGYPLAVKYDESLGKHLAEGNALVKNHEETFRIVKIVDDAYKTEGVIEYSQWLDCYNHYTNPETSNKLFDKCAALAIIGLRDLEADLNNKQKKWCINFLLQAVKEIIFREMNSAYLLEHSFNILEEDIILSSLHYLLNSTNNKKEKTEMLQLIFFLICNISTYPKIKTLTTYMRNTFSNVYPDDFALIHTCLIKYSQFLYKNKKKYYETRLKNIDKLREEENDFIFSMIKSGDLKFDIKLVKFDHFNQHILCRALAIIPLDEISERYLQFLKNILEQILNYLNKEDIYENKSLFARPNRERININELLLIHSFTADVILSSSIKISKQIIDILLSIPLSAANIQEETEDFVGSILNQMALKLADEGNENPDSLSYTTHFNRFWDIWEYMFNALKDKPFNFLTNKLLLDISCLCNDIRGQPYKKQCELLKGKKNLYGEIVSKFGKKNLITVINIFTNIGMSSLFPDCISWIVDICKKEKSAIQALNTIISITMVKKLFYQRMADIAKDDDILNNYIWLLDTMIDLGISEAYYLRENVITFKKTTHN